MRNLFIRLFSFIICISLLAGGIALTIVETMSNPELMADFEEVNNAEWIPGFSDLEDEEDDDDQIEDENGDETGDESGDETGDEIGDEIGDETGDETGDQTGDETGSNE